MSKAQREEFAQHAQRLGLSEGEIVYAPWRQVGALTSPSRQICFPSSDHDLQPTEPQLPKANSCPSAAPKGIGVTHCSHLPLPRGNP